VRPEPLSPPPRYPILPPWGMTGSAGPPLAVASRECRILKRRRNRRVKRASRERCNSRIDRSAASDQGVRSSDVNSRIDTRASPRRARRPSFPPFVLATPRRECERRRRAAPRRATTAAAAAAGGGEGEGEGEGEGGPSSSITSRHDSRN
jgi:hypothetical protein